MKKFQIQILHHIYLTREIEAEDHDHALKIAETLSDDIKPKENYASSELSVTEIQSYQMQLNTLRSQVREAERLRQTLQQAGRAQQGMEELAATLLVQQLQ